MAITLFLGLNQVVHWKFVFTQYFSKFVWLWITKRLNIFASISLLKHRGRDLSGHNCHFFYVSAFSEFFLSSSACKINRSMFRNAVFVEYVT